MSDEAHWKLSRRELLALLGAGALLTRRAAAADSGLHVAALDHVGLTVSDPQKSAAFYARVFGNGVYKYNQTSQRLVKLGPSYISLRPPEQGRQRYRVDHICPGIEAFDPAVVKRYLERQAVSFRDTVDFGLDVNDPDGIQIQTWTENSWALSVRAASPESYPAVGDPIFQPVGFDHILLDVTDPDTSVAFYEKLFGLVTQRSNDRTWFQVGKSRIGLLAVATGGPPGVNHFCVSAAAFKYDAVMKRLEQAGARLEAPEVTSAPEFRDPDGILVQVMSSRPAA